MADVMLYWNMVSVFQGNVPALPDEVIGVVTALPEFFSFSEVWVTWASGFLSYVVGVYL